MCQTDIDAKVVVAEQNLGQFAGYLRMKVDGFVPYQFNEVKGQPFVVSELVDAFFTVIILIYAAHNTTAISGNLHLANHRTNATQHYSTTIRRSEKN